MCVCVSVCVVWYMGVGVGGCECGKGTAEKGENRKGNELEKIKEIMCPLQYLNPQPCACEAIVLNSVLLRMC